MKSIGQEYVEAHVIEIQFAAQRCQAEQTPRYDR
jgi:hypothetical protein